MTRMFIAALLSLALVGTGAAAPAASSGHHLRLAAAAKPCSSGYRHAVIGGAHKCLRRGQFCARSRDRGYHRYGFHCHTRDSRGSYHLT
jgi:hypothetical protein